MDILLTLLSGFVECLLLIWAVEAYRQGRHIYGVAAIGLLLALIGRLSREFAPAAETALLQYGGLAAAAVVLAFDLLTEEVEVSPRADDPRS